MEKIIVKSPTRVDLAGGTLDLWPLFLFVGGAKTVNVAIDIFTTAQIEPLSGTQVEIVSEDLKISQQFANLKDFLTSDSPKLKLLQVVVGFWNPRKGFKLTTSSQSPVGGGIGGSSSLVVSMMKAFQKFVGGPEKSLQELVNICHNLEAAILQTPTGTQDYVPAIAGGLNLIEYGVAGFTHSCAKFDDPIFAESFLLVDTGKAHHSGLNNFEVMQRAVNKDPKTLKALMDLKQVSEEMAQACLSSSWERFSDLFQREYEARIKLAPAFSSPEIDKLARLTASAGARGIKICGAGGGGCVLVWCRPDKRDEVKDACQKAGFTVLHAKPVGPLG